MRAAAGRPSHSDALGDPLLEFLDVADDADLTTAGGELGELVVLLAAIVFVLFTWVFPFIAADILPPPDGTVDTSAAPTP